MKTRSISLTVLLVACLVAMNTKADFLWSPVYDSVDDAAVAALQYVAEIADDDTEYLGIVYEINGKYLFTVPVSGDADEPLISDIQWPAQATMAALYHNHVSGGNGEFSSIDIRHAIKLGVPTYIAIADEANAVRKWDPADRASVHYRLGLGNPQTRGELVSDTVVDVLARRD